jgi:vacuole morphology and inheritance protein 14
MIRWGELLEKFRSVQERARRAQRYGSDGDDGPQFGVGELRIVDSLEGKGAKEAGRGIAPPVPAKDAGSTPAATSKARTGFGKQLGRFGGAVAGRGKRNPP